MRFLSLGIDRIWVIRGESFDPFRLKFPRLQHDSDFYGWVWPGKTHTAFSCAWKQTLLWNSTAFVSTRSSLQVGRGVSLFVPCVYHFLFSKTLREATWRRKDLFWLVLCWIWSNMTRVVPGSGLRRAAHIFALNRKEGLRRKQGQAVNLKARLPVIHFLHHGSITSWCHNQHSATIWGPKVQKHEQGRGGGAFHTQTIMRLLSSILCKCRNYAVRLFHKYYNNLMFERRLQDGTTGVQLTG